MNTWTGHAHGKGPRLTAAGNVVVRLALARDVSKDRSSRGLVASAQRTPSYADPLPASLQGFYESAGERILVVRDAAGGAFRPN